MKQENKQFIIDIQNLLGTHSVSLRPTQINIFVYIHTNITNTPNPTTLHVCLPEIVVLMLWTAS